MRKGSELVARLMVCDTETNGLSETVILTKKGRAVKEAFQRYEVRGTSDDIYGGPPYREPWFLIDVSSAEPDVNWPGDLVAEYDNVDAAQNHFWNLVASAVEGDEL